MTREKFLKNSVVQTEAAIRMAKENYRILTQDKNKDYLEDITKQGFNVQDAMAAGWLSGDNGSIASWSKLNLLKNLEKMIMVQTLCRECCLLKNLQI